MSKQSRDKKYHRSSEKYKAYLKSPRRKYQEHKSHAKQRQVPFLLTFEEWWGIWEKSGKWAKRGNRKGKYCMHRIADKGGYETGNVYISTCERNSWGAISKLNNSRHPDDNAHEGGLFADYDGSPRPDIPF